jgi:asparagine synthase (glutamine-hydrolysing)
VERPKVGFTVPIDQWLRGPLRSWADDLLSAERLERDELLRGKRVQAAWDDYRAGRENEGLGMWAVLMFQAWRDRWLA